MSQHAPIGNDANTMKEATLDELAVELADNLREGLCSHKPRLFTELLRLLAGGRPVSLEDIGASLHISPKDVFTALGAMSSVQFDQQGNVVGSGLTLTPTPHHFHVRDHKLFTWCALDTLLFPVILGEPARVQSPCPVTGVKVQLTVTPEAVEYLEPTNAVVSIVVPEPSHVCCDVRGAFCNEVNFFSSPEAASNGVPEKGAIVLGVHEAYLLGHMLIEHLFKESSDV